MTTEITKTKVMALGSEFYLEDIPTVERLQEILTALRLVEKGCDAGINPFGGNLWPIQVHYRCEAVRGAIPKVEAEIARRFQSPEGDIQVQEQQQQQQVQVWSIARLCGVTGCPNPVNPNSKLEYCLAHSDWHGLD